MLLLHAIKEWWRGMIELFLTLLLPPIRGDDRRMWVSETGVRR